MKTELVFILDRSGSMCGLENDTIGGFNALLEKQKKEPGQALVTTVLFDDRYEVLHDRIFVDRIAPITAADYYVRGCTALLDAIGRTIQRVSAAQRNDAPKERPEKTLLAVTTDGLENASQEYNYAQVRAHRKGTGMGIPVPGRQYGCHFCGQSDGNFRRQGRHLQPGFRRYPGKLRRCLCRRQQYPGQPAADKEVEGGY